MPLAHDMDHGPRYLLATLTGIVLPSANPTALRTTAELYEHLGHQITHELTHTLERTRTQVHTHFSGRASRSFDHSLAQFTTGERDYIGHAG
ncbi:hypothetical protein, partial [Nocardiopsis sp. CNT312]|uniref:hypothetical protein n=1 Tax=Nocardiopsis sp. CNT312 TaxID=1137268 RepID=UPI0012DFA690